MRIASIDYGDSIGLAIAELERGSGTLNLKRYLLDTFDRPANVVTLIKGARCWSVVMERKPSNAPSTSTKSFDVIHDELTVTQGFIKGGDLLSRKQLVTVSPGTWKPLIKALDLGDSYKVWNCSNQHEKDAMGLLYYVLRIQLSTNIEVTYV